MIVFANRTWAYIEDINFDGIMNSHVHEQVKNDTNLNYFQDWDHEVCYTSNLANDVNKLKDTIWLCLENSESDSLDGLFYMPVNGNITSHYGWRNGRSHNGTDLDLSTGDTVRAAWGGKVRYAKYNTSGFGNLVIIRHHNGLETFYAHLNGHLVVPDQIVNPGDPIGLGGNTGHSTGSHLHFEVRFYDIPMNPEKIIDFQNHEVYDENLMVHRGLFKPSGTTSSAVTQSVASSDMKYYKVKSGDTLGAIAARNRTTVSRICSLNGIRPTTPLQIGKNLRIR